METVLKFVAAPFRPFSSRQGSWHPVEKLIVISALAVIALAVIAACVADPSAILTAAAQASNTL